MTSEATEPAVTPPRPAGAPSRRRGGTFVRRAHVWLGLVSAVGVIVVSATGIILNHRASLGLGQEGPPAVEGQDSSLAAALPLRELLALAYEAADGAAVRTVAIDGNLERPNGPGDVNRVMLRPATATAQVRFNDRRHTEVVLDWSTGAVLDVAPRDDVTVEHVHSGELLGQRGVIVGDLVAAVLVVLAISGAALWVRRHRERRRAFPPRATRWMRTNWWFHLVAGLLAATYTVVLCVTGVMLNHKRELGLMPEPLVVAPSEVVERFDTAPLERIVGWAVEARGGSAAGVGADDVRFLDYRPGAGYAKARFKDAEHEVIVDVYEGRIYSDQTRRDRWVEDLHSGVRFGPQGTWLSDLTAGLLIALTANGLYLWLAPAWRSRARPRPADLADATT